MRVLWLALLLLLSGCASNAEVEKTQPLVAKPDGLDLIVTDLVSTMIQIPNYNPVVTTLQFARPNTVFGEKLLVAVRQAGYGVQLVEGDLGPNYVSYAERLANTDLGEVTDYLINVNELEIRREYRNTENGVYPSSLMYVSGLDDDREIVVNDWFFAEQGGDEAFVSGVDTGEVGAVGIEAVNEILADKNQAVRPDRRTRQSAVLDQAVQKMHESQRKQESAIPTGYRRTKKMVLLFADNQTLTLGPHNKAAILKFLELRGPEDIIEISACDDADGENRMAEQRAVRIKEELQGHELPMSKIVEAACVRASYRHESDDSPVPVALYLLRRGTGGN